MRTPSRIAAWTLAAASLFGAGYVAGQSPFGMPRTIIHVSIVKWKEGTSEADKIAAVKGIKKMAMKIPGIKNIWIKPARVQPRDFHYVFAIEFKDAEALKTYTEHPAHEEWLKHFLPVRETSISPQITND